MLTSKAHGSSPSSSEKLRSKKKTDFEMNRKNVGNLFFFFCVAKLKSNTFWIEFPVFNHSTVSRTNYCKIVDWSIPSNVATVCCCCCWWWCWLCDVACFAATEILLKLQLKFHIWNVNFFETGLERVFVRFIEQCPSSMSGDLHLCACVCGQPIDSIDRQQQQWW